jgi:hypothetical protein
LQPVVRSLAGQILMSHNWHWQHETSRRKGPKPGRRDCLQQLARGTQCKEEEECQRQRAKDGAQYQSVVGLPISSRPRTSLFSESLMKNPSQRPDSCSGAASHPQHGMPTAPMGRDGSKACNQTNHLKARTPLPAILTQQGIKRGHHACTRTLQLQR